MHLQFDTIFQCKPSPLSFAVFCMNIITNCRFKTAPIKCLMFHAEENKNTKKGIKIDQGSLEDKRVASNGIE